MNFISIQIPVYYLYFKYNVNTEKHQFDELVRIWNCGLLINTEENVKDELMDRLDCILPHRRNSIKALFPPR